MTENVSCISLSLSLSLSLSVVAFVGRSLTVRCLLLSASNPTETKWRSIDTFNGCIQSSVRGAAKMFVHCCTRGYFVCVCVCVCMCMNV
jgi:hypothetical protein